MSLKNKTITLVDFRDISLVTRIVAAGANVTSLLSDKTDIAIAEDMTSPGVERARILGIMVIPRNEFTIPKTPMSTANLQRSFLVSPTKRKSTIQASASYATLYNLQNILPMGLIDTESRIGKPLKHGDVVLFANPSNSGYGGFANARFVINSPYKRYFLQNNHEDRIHVPNTVSSLYTGNIGQYYLKIMDIAPVTFDKYSASSKSQSRSLTSPSPSPSPSFSVLSTTPKTMTVQTISLQSTIKSRNSA